MLTFASVPAWAFPIESEQSRSAVLNFVPDNNTAVVYLFQTSHPSGPLTLFEAKEQYMTSWFFNGREVGVTSEHTFIAIAIPAGRYSIAICSPYIPAHYIDPPTYFTLVGGKKYYFVPNFEGMLFNTNFTAVLTSEGDFLTKSKELSLSGMNFLEATILH